MSVIVELKDVTKKFAGVTALKDVNLSVQKGEVVGLIGDNGAGKSTLIKTLVGVHAPDSGSIEIQGKLVEKWNALRAREAGIETVFQDKALCPQQSIVWNIFMGKELTYPFGFVRQKEQIEVANRLIREIGFTSELIDAESPVGNLSGGETQKVFDFIANVKETGRSVLFIGHNIYHVYDISDRFVILDRGEVIHKLDKKEVASAEDLMKIMRDTIKGH